MKIQPKDRRAPLRATLGEMKSSSAVENVQLVNAIIREIYPASVYVYDGSISHMGYKESGREEQLAKEVVDGQGKYLVLGLIDAREHIKSSVMTPRNFAKAVIPKETTTVITDPHETGDVWSTEGVWYMHGASEGLPICQLIDIPSYVPAVPGLEHTGVESEPAWIEELAKLERVVGLAKVMDYLDVIHGSDCIMGIIRTAGEHGLYLQGHALFVEGGMLSAYLCGGPNTYRKSRTAGEALEKMRNGMRMDARDSSITKNVEATWNEVKDFRFFDSFCPCTDDREIDDILHSGHISGVIRAVTRYGIEPVAATKSVTLNSVRGAGLQSLGAVAPGYAADMLLVDDLRELTPSHAFYAGGLVAQEGKLLIETENKSYSLESVNPVHTRKLAAKDSTTHPPASQRKVEVSLMKYYDMNLSITDIMCEEVWVEDGRIDISEDQGLKSVAMTNHYEGNDNIALGLVRGFGTETGVLASMVSRGSHNLTIVYDNPEEAPMAAEEPTRTGGGVCAVKEGKILHTLALSLASLMSPRPAEELAGDNAAMKDTNRALGPTNMENPLPRIVTLAFPAIPGAKMSDMRLVQVATKRIVSLFPE